jgi:hypothetical protein
MENWHITFAGADRPTLAATPAERLAVTRTLARVGGGCLLFFCVVDDHVHVVIRTTRAQAGRLASALAQAWSVHIARPLDPARIRPVEGRAHLESLVRYVLDQTTHHKLDLDTPVALWEGSAFPDLVGARVLQGFRPDGLREVLPRFERSKIWSAVGLPLLDPASDEELAAVGPAAVARSALAAIGRTEFASRADDVVRARIVVASIGRRLGWHPSTLADQLGSSMRSVRRHSTAEVDPRIGGAMRLQVAIRAARTGAGIRPFAGGEQAQPRR